MCVHACVHACVCVCASKLNECLSQVYACVCMYKAAMYMQGSHIFSLSQASTQSSQKGRNTNNVGKKGVFGVNVCVCVCLCDCVFVCICICVSAQCVCTVSV